MDATGKVVLIATLVLLVWEAWTLLNQIPKDTISETIGRAALVYPAVVSLPFGLLMGHWFLAACAGASWVDWIAAPLSIEICVHAATIPRSRPRMAAGCLLTGAELGRLTWPLCMVAA